MSTGWGGLNAARPTWLKDRMINLIVQMGTARHPDMPHVPSWVDVAKTEDDKKLLWLFGANADIGKSIVAPPGMPPARVAMLRAAFTAMLKDPAFVADVKKANMDFDHAPGERLQQLVTETIELPEALRARARTIYRSAGQK